MCITKADHWLNMVLPKNEAKVTAELVRMRLNSLLALGSGSRYVHLLALSGKALCAVHDFALAALLPPQLYLTSATQPCE